MIVILVEFQNYILLEISDNAIYQVQGAVFDLPEDIAKELLEKEVPEGNSLSMISKVLMPVSLTSVGFHSTFLIHLLIIPHLLGF